MAEVTERDRRVARGLGLPWESTLPAGEPIALRRLVAYREECVAEERAERERMAVAMQEAIDREVAPRLKAEARLRAVIEALRQISEPDQGPLSTALATGDHMRIIQAVTHALNTGRDIARAALRDAQASPDLTLPHRRYERLVSAVNEAVGQLADDVARDLDHDNRAHPKWWKAVQEERKALLALDASPKPEASKQAGHEDEAHAEKLSIALGTICAYCGQPKTAIAPIWCVRQHGGRDGK